MTDRVVRRRRSVFGAAFAIVLMGWSAVPLPAQDAKGKAGQKPSIAAKDAALAYVKLFKERQAIKAVDSTWDFDVLLATIFGDDMRTQTTGQRADIRQRFVGMLHGALANEQIATVMASATYSDFTEKPSDGDDVAVDFVVTLGDQKLDNRLIFRPVKDAWKIVDAGNAGALMGPSIRRAYEKDKKADPATTPWSFVKAMTANQPKG